jgi:acetyltransferase-like isoleucine patch superfamily enzyme
MLGLAHFTPTACSIHLGKGARFTVNGSVQIHRGTRVFVNDGAHLQMGDQSYVNDCSTVTCFDQITIGSRCAISWNANILDSNIHELAVEGEVRPRSRPVLIGDDVWIGTGVIVLAGTTIGSGAVVGAGSVVNSTIPSAALVAGNPARTVREAVSWLE